MKYESIDAYQRAKNAHLAPFREITREREKELARAASKAFEAYMNHLEHKSRTTRALLENATFERKNALDSYRAALLMTHRAAIDFGEYDAE